MTISNRAPVPADVYDSLYRNFNPAVFDAERWVTVAQAADMKYIVFVTKHHDGFCMFDASTTDYGVTNSPLGREVTAEIARACQRAGFSLGFYYSPPDWHHPDCRTSNHARYVAYMHDQVRELCTKDGRIDIMWFDGLDCTAAELDSHRLLAMVRHFQPGILINNRAGLPGDFRTPEQHVGHSVRLWESCFTMGEQWSYRPADRIKTCDEIVHLLELCNASKGNLLLNIGPTPTGEMDPEYERTLREVGRVLRQRRLAAKGGF